MIDNFDMFEVTLWVKLILLHLYYTIEAISFYLIDLILLHCFPLIFFGYFLKSIEVPRFY